MRERNSYHASYHNMPPSLQHKRLQGSHQEESIHLMPAVNSSDQWAGREKPKLSPGSVTVHTDHCSCLKSSNCGEHLRQSPRKCDILKKAATSASGSVVVHRSPLQSPHLLPLSSASLPLTCSCLSNKPASLHLLPLGKNSPLCSQLKPSSPFPQVSIMDLI